MRDRSLKYSEAYIREKTEELKRDFGTEVIHLRQQRLQSMNSWKKDSSLKKALNAAYFDELEQLQLSFQTKAEELQDELNLLISSRSQHLRRQTDFLQQGVRDIFRMISQSAVLVSSIVLSRTLF